MYTTENPLPIHISALRNKALRGCSSIRVNKTETLSRKRQVLCLRTDPEIVQSASLKQGKSGLFLQENNKGKSAAVRFWKRLLRMRPGGLSVHSTPGGIK